MSKMKPILRFLKRSLVFPPVWIVAYFFLAYHSLDLFIRAGYGSGVEGHLNTNISGQKSLLSVTLHGQPKEQVLDSVKKVLARPEHRSVELEITDKAIRIDGINIYLSNDKVTFVE
jgi:hypothetical protein